MRVKIWHMILVFIAWVGLMFLPATVNQIKLNSTFDIAKSRENYFYYLMTQKPVTSIILILLFCGVVIGILRKWRMTKYFAFSFMVLYIYDMFLNLVLSRIFVGVSLKVALSKETFEGLWRTFGLGFFLVSLVGIVFSILLFVYTISDGKKQKR
ncbi:hypothetical protein [Lactococcus allomyrinae]|uniref:Uncharacterized protein n=1 Tax=Lactococcus allomyrinae TaxID=2419773 RepID=A0A387BHN1_9LACT|nr:hypothetical protein [Lactococcus allomyrinae]AYG00616.1 hypothetical protein D7I46_05620 [Lactococcus allomyrinae]